jgi:hypothetical protein
MADNLSRINRKFQPLAYTAPDQPMESLPTFEEGLAKLLGGARAGAFA